MKIDFTPFQIGMQYENWEFDLEPIDTDTLYDKYWYFKDDIKSLLDLEGFKIYLYFDWDILFKVEVTFEINNPRSSFIYLGRKLGLKYGNEKNNHVDKTRVIKVWKDIRKHLILEHNLQTDLVSLIVVGVEYLNIE